MSSIPSSLYDEDFVRWAETQADALRDAAGSGTNLPLDWDNLIEEIESLARADRRELKSRLATVIEHLLKLAHSTAMGPRPGWKGTVRRARADIEDLLKESPSLEVEVPAMIAGAEERAVKLASKELADHGEISQAVSLKIAGAQYDVGQVLSDWFPDRPDLDAP